jgi:hypothetical protein
MLEELFSICKGHRLIEVLGCKPMSENMEFVDDLICLSSDKKKIAHFYSQVHSSSEESQRSLIAICKWDIDMAQLVQIKLLKEIHEQLIRGKFPIALPEIEINVTKALESDPLVKSFLDQSKSEEHLRSFLFPKILLEKSANVESFTTKKCTNSGCWFKFRANDQQIIESNPKNQKVKDKKDLTGYNCFDFKIPNYFLYALMFCNLTF